MFTSIIRTIIGSKFHIDQLTVTLFFGSGSKRPLSWRKSQNAVGYRVKSMISSGPLFRQHTGFTGTFNRVLSTGGWGKLPSPPNLSASPPKVFLKKKFKAISNKDLFDDDFKESVKVTNVQKCDFSQS